LIELFIYYRLSSAHAAAAKAEVMRWQRELDASHPGLCSGLLMRPGESDGLQTWMETYTTNEPSRLNLAEGALRAQIECGPMELQALTVGARNVEAFIRCVS
jgi:hypothetical protein